MHNSHSAVEANAAFGRAHGDVPVACLRPPVSKFAMMDFSAHDDLIEVGYRHAIEVLEHKSPSAVVSSPDRQMWGDTT